MTDCQPFHLISGKHSLRQLLIRTLHYSASLTALDFSADNVVCTAPKVFFMLVPRSRYVRIHQALYGHPKVLLLLSVDRR